MYSADSSAICCALPKASALRGSFPGFFQDIMHRLDNSSRGNAVLFIVGSLLDAPPLGFRSALSGLNRLSCLRTESLYRADDGQRGQ